MEIYNNNFIIWTVLYIAQCVANINKQRSRTEKISLIQIIYLFWRHRRRAGYLLWRRPRRHQTTTINLRRRLTFLCAINECSRNRGRVLCPHSCFIIIISTWKIWQFRNCHRPLHLPWGGKRQKKERKQMLSIYCYYLLFVVHLRHLNGPVFLFFIAWFVGVNIYTCGHKCICSLKI